jgi:hypothetical protein
MSDASALRFCKDCRWFRPQDNGGRPKCGHASAILPGETGLVHGKPSAPVVLPCHFARSQWGTIDTCGPGGRFWEPAEIGFGDP